MIVRDGMVTFTKNRSNKKYLVDIQTGTKVEIRKRLNEGTISFIRTVLMLEDVQLIRDETAIRIPNSSTLNEDEELKVLKRMARGYKKYFDNHVTKVTFFYDNKEIAI